MPLGFKCLTSIRFRPLWRLTLKVVNFTSQFRMGGCSCLPTHDLGPDILRPPTDLI